MKLSDLTIIGTHDSATYKLKFPFNLFAKTQNISIVEQLNLGVRYFDIRLNLDKDGLQCYHGLAKCNISWQEVLTIFNRFLDTHPYEFILLRVVRADDQTFQRKITNDEWEKSFIKESPNVVITTEDLDISKIKNNIVVVNFNWRLMVPQVMTLGYSLDTKNSDVTKLIGQCNSLIEYPYNSVKLIYTNADGSLCLLNNIKYLNKIPYPKSFFKLFNKRIDELKIVKGVWYIFDFIDEVPILNKINH